MVVPSRGRRALLLLGATALALTGTACGSSDSDTTDKDSAACAPFKEYQGHDGTTVSIYSSIRDTEADMLKEAWKPFSDCTGIKIAYEGSGDFEAQVQVKSQAGTPPDLAFFPQPGLLSTFATAKKLKPASAKLKALAMANWSEDWLNYGTVDDTFYAAPLGSSVKSFVWYSPKYFKDNKLSVPQTWDELIALSDSIAAKGIKPWCAGIESGGDVGWPATDWVEDVMLRVEGPEVYDQWVDHTIPFNDPKVVTVLDKVGTILRNPAYVNGGFGDVKSITTTSFQEAGTPILDGKCALHRQASFYAAQWPEGTTVAEDGDVYAFYFPPVDPDKGKPVLGAGEFVAAFTDRPEVQTVQYYLATADFANRRAELGSWATANKGLRLENVASPIDKLSVQLLHDPKTVFRFDGSDLMPAKVGAGTFWKGMTDWINGKDTKSVLDYVEASWR